MFQSCSKRFDPIRVKLSSETQTVPDMSFTPREILSKFSRGERVPLGFEGVYDSEDDEDKLDAFDPSVFEDDPTRDPNFDRFDYVEEKTALEERQQSRKRRSKVKPGSDSQRKASAEELSASDATKRETISGEADQAPPAQSPSEQ